MTLPQREPPDGFTEKRDSTLWNVGHLFTWSEFYECWLDDSYRMTVKPGESERDTMDREVEALDFIHCDHRLFYSKRS